MSIGIIIAGLAIFVLIVAGYVTWRDRRREEEAETDQSASLSGGPKEPV